MYKLTFINWFLLQINYPVRNYVLLVLPESKTGVGENNSDNNVIFSKW